MRYVFLLNINENCSFLERWRCGTRRVGPVYTRCTATPARSAVCTSTIIRYRCPIHDQCFGAGQAPAPGSYCIKRRLSTITKQNGENIIQTLNQTKIPRNETKETNSVYLFIEIFVFFFIKTPPFAKFAKLLNGPKSSGSTLRQKAGSIPRKTIADPKHPFKSFKSAFLREQKSSLFPSFNCVDPGSVFEIPVRIRIHNRS